MALEAGLIKSGERDGELVAGGSGNQGGVGECVDDDGGCACDQQVAYGVAVGLVDRAQLVGIDQQQPGPRAAALV